MSGLEPDLSRIFASLAEGVWQRDLVNGEAWYSPRYKELLGFADDELPNDAAAIAARIHPEDRAALERAREEALATFAPSSIETRILTRGGEWRWFRSIARVWPDASGRPAMLLGSVTDVHAEKQALLKGEAMAARFERAMAASSEAHFERVVGIGDFFISPRLPEMLGHPPGSPRPTYETFLSWIHPDDLPGFEEMVQRAAVSPGTYEIDYRLRHADGSYRWFRARGRSEPDAQGHLRMTGMLGNIHAQKLAQQELAQHRDQLRQLVDDRTARLSAALLLAQSQRTAAEQANLAKATFLGHMSHELRTPLNGLMGMTQLALRVATSDTQRKYLELAEQSGQTLLRILNDVLDFAKAEAGKLKLFAETFDLPRLVTETVRSFMPQIGQRPVHLLFDCSGEITHVTGDAGRVRQIVSNLVGNALKFTDSGSIAVVVDIAEAASSMCSVRIEVSDSGVGMDEDTLQRVFEAFEQADTSATRRHGGTGLGLPIVRLLAQMMDGEVKVRSESGVGSTFTVDLKLAVAAQPQGRLSRTAGSGHAWLIYRSEEPARWVRRRLERLGWTADVLPDVASAVERLRCGTSQAQPRSVVVADEAMSDAAGMASLRQALPAWVPMSLLIRPDFGLMVVQETAVASGVSLAIAPLTEADLHQLLSPGCVEQADAVITTPMGISPAPPCVLVVEDVAMNQMIIGEMIRVLGLRTRMASGGEEALERCQCEAPDLVLMDIQMPGMDGHEASRRLRELQASSCLPRFPIVALTANAMEADRQASLDAGIDEHVTKPIDLDGLRKVLARWLPAAGLVA